MVSLVYLVPAECPLSEGKQKKNSLKSYVTCPLVTKVHFEVKKYSKDGCDCILIGHLGHPEVEGTMGQFDSSNGGKIHLVQDVNDVDILKISQPENVAYVTINNFIDGRTSAIIDALRQNILKLLALKECICYATQNRQDVSNS